MVPDDTFLDDVTFPGDGLGGGLTANPFPNPEKGVPGVETIPDPPVVRILESPENTIVDFLNINTLVGTSGSDQIFGLGGDDLILGAEANDQLFGNEGADALYGHQDNDTITRTNQYLPSAKLSWL